MSEYIDYRMGDYLGEYIMDIRDDDSGLIKEKITRCRDCREYTDKELTQEVNKPKKSYCMFFSSWNRETDVLDYWYPEPDGFCKWGEPR